VTHSEEAATEFWPTVGNTHLFLRGALRRSRQTIRMMMEAMTTNKTTTDTATMTATFRPAFIGIATTSTSSLTSYCPLTARLIIIGHPIYH